MDALRQRGLGGSRLAKAADAIDIRYGHQLLAQTSGGWQDFLVVTSPTAYRVGQKYLATAPLAHTYVHSLDANYLQQITAELPDRAQMVVSLGGGQVIDAAKYVAAVKDLPLVHVPTIVSTGAIIHGYCATFEGRRIVGDREEWAWADCEAVLVDYDLVLEAPAHLNTAGLGDVLCEHSGVAEWRFLQKQRATHKPGDEPDLTALRHFHASITAAFPATLDRNGHLTPESVHFIMSTLQRRDALRVRHPLAPNADHAVLFALEEVNDKSWIHGEVVALGALIVCWRCGEGAAEFAQQLDRCLVQWRPAQVGIGKEELRRGLAYLPSYLAAEPKGLEYGSILRTLPILDADFEALWDFLHSI